MWADNRQSLWRIPSPPGFISDLVQQSNRSLEAWVSGSRSLLSRRSDSALVILEIFLAGCIIGFSLLMLVTSLMSYSRLRHLRFAYVAVAFLLFLIKGVVALLGALPEDMKTGVTIPAEILALDLLILLFLYLAVAKR